jgi:hypothetical protein
VCGGAFERRVADLEQDEYLDKSLHALKQKLVEGKELVLKGIAFVKEHGPEYMDLHGRRLVDAALVVLIGHLLLKQATAPVGGERKHMVARRFIEMNLPGLQRDITLVCTGDRSALDGFETFAGPVPAAN